MLRQRKILRFTKENELRQEIEEVKLKKEVEKDQNRSLQFLALVGELGYSISLPIAGGALLGRFLDNKFGSSPKFTLSLIFFGLFLGFYRIIGIIKKVK